MTTTKNIQIIIDLNHIEDIANNDNSKKEAINNSKIDESPICRYNVRYILLFTLNILLK